MLLATGVPQEKLNITPSQVLIHTIDLLPAVRVREEPRRLIPATPAVDQCQANHLPVLIGMVVVQRAAMIILPVATEELPAAGRLL